MIHEIVYYGFDNVPVEVTWFYRDVSTRLFPTYNLKQELGTNNVNEWINRLYKTGRCSIDAYSYMSKVKCCEAVICICVWNTGMGAYTWDHE